jgi:hypothetical protein
MMRDVTESARVATSRIAEVHHAVGTHRDAIADLQARFVDFAQKAATDSAKLHTSIAAHESRLDTQAVVIAQAHKVARRADEWVDNFNARTFWQRLRWLLTGR